MTHRCEPRTLKGDAKPWFQLAQSKCSKGHGMHGSVPRSPAQTCPVAPLSRLSTGHVASRWLWWLQKMLRVPILVKETASKGTTIRATPSFLKQARSCKAGKKKKHVRNGHLGFSLRFTESTTVSHCHSVALGRGWLSSPDGALGPFPAACFSTRGVKPHRIWQKGEIAMTLGKSLLSQLCAKDLCGWW